MGVLAALDVETKMLLVSQLDYQLTAYHSGFPPYIAPEPGASATALKPTPGAAVEPLVVPAAPSPRDQEREALQAAVGVRLVDKTYVPSDWQARRYEDFVALEFEYANKADKDIRAFTGTVVFKDIFERPFLRLNLTFDQRIAAGHSVRDKDRSLKTNQFSDEQQKLINTELENLRVGFEVESVLFADGTKMGSVAP